MSARDDILASIRENRPQATRPLPDVPLFNRSGLAVAVPHSPPAVAARAHYVTRNDGGFGAVREVCELILEAQGSLAQHLAAYGA